MRFKRWAIPVLISMLMIIMLSPVSLAAAGEDELNDTTWGEDSLKLNSDGSFSWKSNWTSPQTGVNYDVHGTWVPRETGTDENGNTEVTTQITSVIYTKDNKEYSRGTEEQKSVRCWDGTWVDYNPQNPYGDCPVKPPPLPPPPPPEPEPVQPTPPPDPNTGLKTCPTGETIPNTEPCPRVKSCPGGVVVYEHEMCPSSGGSDPGGGGTPPPTGDPAQPPTNPESPPPPPPPPPPCQPRSDTRSLRAATPNYMLFSPGGVAAVSAQVSGTPVGTPTVRTSWGTAVDMTRVGAMWEANVMAVGGIGPGTITVSTTLIQADGCGGVYGPNVFSRKIDVQLYKPKDWEPPVEEEPELLPANLTLEEYIEDCLTTPEPYYCGISLRMARDYALALRAYEHAYRWELTPGRWERLIRRIDSVLVKEGDEPTGLLEPWPNQGQGSGHLPFP